MYPCCSFVSSLWGFLSFYGLAFVVFISFSKDAMFTLSPYSKLKVTPVELYIRHLVWLECTLLLLRRGH